jgi:predicted TIM-barrel fold metal-dependent hydrolase
VGPNDVVLIDSHMHIYPSREIGQALKDGYDIPDYGKKQDVAISTCSGTVEEAREEMDRAGISKAAVLNIFLLPDAPGPPDGLWWPANLPLAAWSEELRQSNEWTCSLADLDARLVPFLSVHPGVMSASESVAHIEALTDGAGARGIKLHPTAQRIHPADPALDAIYALCVQRHLPLVAHTGVDVRGQEFAEFKAFTRVIERFPGLKLILAHLGGRFWRDAVSFAQTYPTVLFDLCEIIEWTDAEHGPTLQQLGRIIHDIGADRVLMGSDFPWYDLDRTVDLVMSLPYLSDEEKELIMGRNASSVLNLS